MNILPWIVLLIALLFPSLADAQGAGAYIRADCATIANPVTGQTWCFDSTARALKVWTGSAYANVSPGIPIGSSSGGTGLDTSALTGVPSISSGTWSVGAVKPPINGSGAGIFAPAACSTITSPVTGTSECLDTTRGVWNNWDGTGWQSDVARATTTVNIMDPRFGATGDGAATTDDGPAIQAAVNAAGNGGAVYFPCKNFNLNTGITITQENIALIGCGAMKMEDQTSPLGGTTLTYRGTGVAILFGITAAQSYGGFQFGVTIRNMAIVGTASGLNGIKVQANGTTNYAARFLLENVYVGEFTGTNGDGILMQYSVAGRLRRVYTRNNGGCGIKITGGTTYHLNGIISRLNKNGVCVASSTTQSVTGVTIDGQSVIESNTSEGLVWDSTNSLTASLAVTDTRIENNNTTAGAYQVNVIGATGKIVNDVRLKNVVFATTNGTGDIQLDFVTGATLSDIYSGAGATKTCVKLASANALGVILAGNIIGGGCSIDPDNRALANLNGTTGVQRFTTTTDVDGLRVTGVGTAIRPFLILQRSDSTTTGSFGGYQINNSLGNGMVQVVGVADGAADAGMMQIFTVATTGVLAERLRVTSTGSFLLKPTSSTAGDLVYTSGGGLQLGAPTGGDPGLGKLNVASGYSANGSAGQSVTTTVRAAGGLADCTLIFTFGLKTGGTC